MMILSERGFSFIFGSVLVKTLRIYNARNKIIAMKMKRREKKRNTHFQMRFDTYSLNYSTNRTKLSEFLMFYSTKSIQQFMEYDGHTLQNVTKESLELEEDENEKKKCEEEKTRFEELSLTLRDSVISTYIASKKTMEINPEHLIIKSQRNDIGGAATSNLYAYRCTCSIHMGDGYIVILRIFLPTIK
ncbi:hypothetical protein BCR32DRAFT_274238 [Anaeromyces robustus]|uniref:Uncharacterized protein n=1 Tax=Anaeromyces robustus TaxID=1754192 RepID=A0A1Y1XPZ8_9FUNG|nr:hypothetical protein BCR32DRAFT_274238 [Anaeromyces robustus]|eukprot:ORX87817.1 hypothetical protein BCR32DRAFT_274238 [Anaeromyces robustus]